MDCLQLCHAKAGKAKSTWPDNKELYGQIKNILTIITYYPRILRYFESYYIN